MSDLDKFEHGEEGTHYACQEMLERYGDKTGCCGCNGHRCMTTKTKKGKHETTK